MRAWWDNVWLWSGLSVVAVAAILAVVAVLVIWWLLKDQQTPTL
ncbi:MAG TPA: hypothetical protein VFA59_23300 [Vicinamibacterales bacterium]|nr:hypothetical protein [Vicinamibacterales bacterium]